MRTCGVGEDVWAGEDEKGWHVEEDRTVVVASVGSPVDGFSQYVEVQMQFGGVGRTSSARAVRST